MRILPFRLGPHARIKTRFKKTIYAPSLYAKLGFTKKFAQKLLENPPKHTKKAEFKPFSHFCFTPHQDPPAIVGAQ